MGKVLFLTCNKHLLVFAAMFRTWKSKTLRPFRNLLVFCRVLDSCRCYIIYKASCERGMGYVTGSDDLQVF